MEEAFKTIAGYVALAVEAAAILMVALGAVEALVRLAFAPFAPFSQGTGTLPRRELWLRFAGWILLALEFALGADIIRTAISPSWDDIGKLAVIAAVRTGLNYFLAHDLESAIQMDRPGE